MQNSNVSFLHNTLFRYVVQPTVGKLKYNLNKYSAIYRYLAAMFKITVFNLVQNSLFSTFKR